MTETNPLATSLTLLWEGLPEQGRGPRRSLSLEHIVATAVNLADESGVDSLSMRTLAQRLGVGTMSLYRYVPSKEELLNLMLDSVVGPSEALISARDDGWREFLTASARDGRRRLKKHPWILQANWSRPVLGPNSVASLEMLLSGLQETPLTDQQKINLATALDSYVEGATRQELLWDHTTEQSGMSDEEFWHHQGPTLARVMESGRYPTMAGLAEDTFDADWDESFSYGLELLLDGVAEQIRAHQEP